MKVDFDNYTIHLYNNELRKLSDYIRKIYEGQNLFIITDQNVYNLYNEVVSKNLNSYKIEYVLVDDKSIKSYLKIVKELINKDIKREDLIVSLGGGTVGDIAGFVAATLFRGIDYIQIPTTLLAQVDSSIGGKTAVDLKEGKNLIGAFKNPKLVFVDTLFLDSLDDKEYANGFAEAIKMAITLDERLYNKLRITNKLDLDDIKDLIELKKAIVIKDPFDQKERIVLNFGHTFGHAIEQKTNYNLYKHGQAVSYGMLMALELGVKKGITPQYLYDDLKMILLKNNLVTLPLLKKASFISAIKNDKKNDRLGINFVFLKDIGITKVINLKSDEL